MRKLVLICTLLFFISSSVYAQTQLKAGDKAPAFSAKDQNGKIVSLTSFKGRKLVLYFYPKDNTPGCTKEACNLRDYKDTLAAQGYTILGVSTDDAFSHQQFIKQYNLPYDLLVDSDAAINKAYGVWVQKEREGKVFYGTARTTFIINESGVITKVIDAVKVDAHAEQILTK
ncbi:thioredoxin-dependent thiol peroxidase [Cytophaga hutchinsonii]|uniref:thioredoxin-dependent thiol peroxidase n=1 Tax=Cytophaga hutchinsonii TaxID=985 RepID=UPI000038E770|nr:thioredoxin-dependent thiol peroxidase [Cytophaga hutchinsonii]SFX07365.1 peroxiredoxin Q/BCP [Cytophaga hutchinsonii ATCC 33406]